MRETRCGAVRDPTAGGGFIYRDYQRQEDVLRRLASKVATRCGGPEEVVNDRVGRLVPREDEEALGSAIEDVLAHRERYDPRSLPTPEVRPRRLLLGHDRPAHGGPVRSCPERTGPMKQKPPMARSTATLPRVRHELSNCTAEF